MSKNTEIKLNIGCGYLNTPKNWVNIDNSLSARLAKYPLIKEFLYKMKILPKRLHDLPWPSSITVLDVRKGLPYKDGTVKYIYTSHLLEHLSRNAVKHFLNECYRVLRKGGIVRIIVPDLQIRIRSYIQKMEDIGERKSNNTSISPADEFLEGLGLFNNEKNNSFLIKSIKFLQGNKNIHKWMYDYYSLEFKLKQCGFNNITQRGYLDSQIEDIGLLDNPDRFRYCLCVEANKG